MTSDGMAYFAFSFLIVVAVAIVIAAGYAVFGKPSTVSGKNRKAQVVNGFRLTGGLLLGFVSLGAFVTAIGVGCFGAKLESSAPLSYSSRTLAFVLAAVSLAFIALTVQRWAKYFAGFIGYGVLNGLLMASSGHLLNNPAIPVRRSWALMMCGVVLISSFVCLRFDESYKLNAVDKLALVSWVVLFVVAANVEKHGLAAITFGCVGLVIAWLFTRTLTHPARHHRSKAKELGR